MNELKETTLLNDQQLEEARSKDQQLEESKIQIFELEKYNADSSKLISKLRADIKFIKQQWKKSAYQIKDNIFTQCLVICPDANFGEVGLDKHVIDCRIEVAPLARKREMMKSQSLLQLKIRFIFIFCILHLVPSLWAFM